jgi:hypothetical protein
MAGSDLRDLTARLQRVRIRGEIVEGDQRELVGRQVEVVVAPVQVQRNIEASTAGRSPLSIEIPFILSPLKLHLFYLHWQHPGWALNA